ncbi:MAG: pyruvate dehydrogenase (acetyl-transferring) E1 component subunit alpha [Candidatus Omnitrophota bacterium]
MLFKEYDPLTDAMLQVMDNEGNIINPEWKPDITDEFVLECYKFMQFARTADLMAVSFQRQGRLYTYPPNLGQEAVACAVGKHIRPRDWLVPSFREMGAWLLKGAKPSDVYKYFGGFEDGSRFSEAPNFLPSVVPIASQLPHAVGIGFAINYKKMDSMVFTFAGDGATSEGDFHESLNFASLWKVPVLFVIQNNQYAISVPVKNQTRSKNLALKAIAYDIPSVKVDGNDFFALYKAVDEAVKHIRAGNGPVVMEAYTFRRGAHTTSDDPTLYRTSAEEQSWAERDPLKRLNGYLIARGLWHEEDDEPLIREYRKEVEKEFARYENAPPYHLEDAFIYMFKDMPNELKQQMDAYQAFAEWEEAQK